MEYRNGPKKVGGSSQRNLLARRFLGLKHWRQSILGQLTIVQLSAGLVLSVVVAGVLAGYQFQSIPDYKEGDIADRTIEAPRDFQVVDAEETDEKKREIIQGGPRCLRSGSLRQPSSGIGIEDRLCRCPANNLGSPDPVPTGGQAVFPQEGRKPSCFPN